MSLQGESENQVNKKKRDSRGPYYVDPKGSASGNKVYLLTVVVIRLTDCPMASFPQQQKEECIKYHRTNIKYFFQTNIESKTKQNLEKYCLQVGFIRKIGMV